MCGSVRWTEVSNEIEKDARLFLDVHTDVGEIANTERSPGPRNCKSLPLSARLAFITLMLHRPQH